MGIQEWDCNPAWFKLFVQLVWSEFSCYKYCNIYLPPNYFENIETNDVTPFILTPSQNIISLMMKYPLQLKLGFLLASVIFILSVSLYNFYPNFLLPQLPLGTVKQQLKEKVKFINHSWTKASTITGYSNLICYIVETFFILVTTADKM